MSHPLLADPAQALPRLCFYQLDPIRDPRWAGFVAGHRKASVFHSVAWLRALRRTYGYEPVVFTTSPPTGELKNGMVFCRIKSWLTGSRLVSLPFSDHCEPLCDSNEEVQFLIRYLQASVEREGWKYVEFRPIDSFLGQESSQLGFQPAAMYFLHILDLRVDLDELFRNLDKDSVQRRIHRADRAGLVEKCGRSKELLKEFYSLFVVTRGRHHLPPIPYSWFQNLIDSHNEALEIRLAFKDSVPVSAILTLRFNDTVYYKYGCSDALFKRFGATPWLLWRALVAAKSQGAVHFDLGRTEEDNVGLLTFKNHWVPKPQELVYWKFPHAISQNRESNRRLRIAKQLFSYMPNSLLRITGRFVYRHIG